MWLSGRQPAKTRQEVGSGSCRSLQRRQNSGDLSTPLSSFTGGGGVNRICDLLWGSKNNSSSLVLEGEMQVYLAKTMLSTTQPGKRPLCLLEVGMLPPSKEAGLTTWPPSGILRLFSVKGR